MEIVLFKVIILKVVAPVTEVFVPVKLIVPIDAENVPLLIQFPLMVCVKVEALKTVEGAIVRFPLMVNPAKADFVFPDKVRLL